MASLRDVERLTLDALRHPARSAAAVALLKRGPGLAPERRLQVVRNSMFDSLGDALAAVFPVTRQLVGDAFFGRVARGFIVRHPLRQPSLHR